MSALHLYVIFHCFVMSNLSRGSSEKDSLPPQVRNNTGYVVVVVHVHCTPH